MKPSFANTALAALALLAPPALLNAQNYSCSTFSIPNLPANARLESVTGVNTLGQIVGNYADSNGVRHGFLRNSDGSITYLSFPDASATSATGINNLGEIVGTYTDSTGRSQLYLRATGGSYSSVPAPAGVNAANQQSGGVNDLGDILALYGASLYLQDAQGNAIYSLPLSQQFFLSRPGATNASLDAMLYDPFYGGSYLFHQDGNNAPISFADAVATYAPGLNNAGTVAGFWEDINRSQGTRLQGPDFSFIHPANTTHFPSVVCPEYVTDGFTNRTQISSVSDNGVAAGILYQGSTRLGVIATPDGTAPGVQLTNDSWVFAAVPIGGTATGTIWITNTGNGPLHIPNLQQSAFFGYEYPDSVHEDFSVVDTDCNPSVRAGGYCHVTFQFKPSEGGTRKAILALADDSPEGPHLIPVTGQGMFSHATISNTSWYLGAWQVGTTTTPGTVYIYNSGNHTITFSPAQIAGPNASDFAITQNTCNSLPANKTCSLSFVATPSAPGFRSATIVLAGDADNTPLNVALSVKGFTH